MKKSIGKVGSKQNFIADRWEHSQHQSYTIFYKRDFQSWEHFCSKCLRTIIIMLDISCASQKNSIPSAIFYPSINITGIESAHSLETPKTKI